MKPITGLHQWRRGVIRTYCPPTLAFAALQTSSISHTLHSRNSRSSSNQRQHWRTIAVGAALAGVACFSNLEPRTARADVAAVDDEAIDWKQYFKGTYENRIRDLSTPEKIFSTFASVHKEGDELWVKYMTVDDFVNAVLPFDFRSDKAKPSFSAETAPAFFKLVDLDQDGLISQSEYVLFSTLLAIPESQIEIAFKMFDLNGNGEIDSDEFNKLFEVMRPESLSAFSFQVATSGAALLQVFFGINNERRLCLDDFRTFIRTLRRAMLEMEFHRYDTHGSGSISAHHFAMSIIGYCSRTHIPTYLKRLDSLDVEGKVSLQEFLDFNHALPRLSDVGLALSLYSKSKKIISKSDFQRAVWAVTGKLLTETQVDIIFHIFDANNDGHLEQVELLGALKQRYENKQFHNRDVGFFRMLSCCKDCFSRQR